MKNKILASIVASSLVVLGCTAIIFSGTHFHVSNSSQTTSTAPLECTTYNTLQKIIGTTFFNEEYEKNLCEKMSKKSDIIFNRLSNEEKEAIKNYTGCNPVAACIYGRNVSNETKNQALKYAELISNLINQNRLEENIYLYRGGTLLYLKDIISNNDIESFLQTNNEQNINHIVNNLNGKCLNLKGFTSTSTSFEKAMKFVKSYSGFVSDEKSREHYKNGVGILFIINAKKGLTYLPLMQNSVFHHENEVLLNRNLILKIKKATFKIERDIYKKYIDEPDKMLFLECETVDNN